MSKTLTRSGDAGMNFEETTVGERAHSVAVDINAKGEAQISVKLYYDEIADLTDTSADTVSETIIRIARRLSLLGIRVAGVALAPAHQSNLATLANQEAR